MKYIAESIQVNIYLMHFLFKVIWNKGKLCCHCFSTLL